MSSASFHESQVRQTDNPSDDSEPESSSGASAAAPNELTVGYVLPLGEAFAPFVTPMVKAIEMARDEINAAGGNVRILPGDSGYSPEVANSVVDSHLASGVSAVIGAAASSISLAIIEKIADAGVVMISPSNTSSTFTTYDDGGYYFRTAPSDALQAVELATLMIDAGVTNAGILHRDDDYGRQFDAALQRVFRESGVKVGASISYDPDSADYATEVNTLKEAEVNGIALIAFDRAPIVIGHKIEAGIGPRSVPLFISAATAGETWKDVDPDNPGVLEGSKVMAPSDRPQHGEETFGDRFAAYAGEGIEGNFSTHSYDALVVVALASLVAGSTEAADYAGAINDITRGGTKCNTYASCAKLIHRGENIDYDGASGPLDFTENGEPSVAGYDVFEFNSEGTLDFLEHVVVHVDSVGPKSTMITG